MLMNESLHKFRKRVIKFVNQVSHRIVLLSPLMAVSLLLVHQTDHHACKKLTPPINELVADRDICFKLTCRREIVVVFHV